MFIFKSREGDRLVLDYGRPDGADREYIEFGHEVHRVIHNAIHNMPWGIDQFWTDSFMKWVPELPYIDQGMIHYHTPQGKIIKTKVGRYLIRICPDLDQSLVQKYATSLSPVELLFTQDQDIIAKAYTNGPRSCMKKEHFKFEDHPARIYGGGDFGLAYTADFRSRAVISVDKKLYVRAYGDVHRVEASLTNLGFKKVKQWPDGLRLPIIHHSRYEKSVLLPYVDGANYAYKTDDSFVLDWECEGFFMRDTDGYFPRIPKTCFFCDAEEVDGFYHYMTDVTEHLFCPDCLGVNVFLCSVTQRYSEPDRMIQLKDGRYYNTSVSHVNGYLDNIPMYVHDDWRIYVKGVEDTQAAIVGFLDYPDPHQGRNYRVMGFGEYLTYENVSMITVILDDGNASGYETEIGHIRLLNENARILLG